MKRIDTHLKENGTKFLDRDVLTYADCVLLPRLQHVRIAGKVSIRINVSILEGGISWFQLSVKP